VVSLTDDMMGGEWEQATRHLRVISGPWIRAEHMLSRLRRLDTISKTVDRSQTGGNYILLDHAIHDLKRAIRNYAHQLEELEREVLKFADDVHKASINAAKNPVEEVDEEMLTKEQYDALGIDRLGALYGLRSPKAKYPPKEVPERMLRYYGSMPKDAEWPDDE
jgi:hypothetical protein